MQRLICTAREVGVVNLSRITPELVNQAIEIYLQYAYDDPDIRQEHLVSFGAALPIDKVLGSFEREETALASYSLRLGCQHYPHMKMALMEAYFHDEYAFAVDRHDGFDFERTGPDYEAWLGIKSKNHQAKVKIEDAWYEAEIPTLRRLKEDRFSRSDVIREFSGHSVLLVDNDQDTVDIMKMILSDAGYLCVSADSLARVKELLKDDEIRKKCGLALVDLMLSDGSGVDAIAMIRANSGTQDIPIMLTSAMSMTDVKDTCADGYLRKPYSAQALVDAVNSAIKRRYDGHDVLVKEKVKADRK